MRKNIVLLSASAIGVVAIAGFLFSGSFKSVCGGRTPKRTEREAIEKAKDLATTRGLFWFDDLGGSAKLVQRLNQEDKCCGAQTTFHLHNWQRTWRVDMATDDLKRPSYAVFVEFTECGDFINKGSLRW